MKVVNSSVTYALLLLGLFLHNIGALNTVSNMLPAYCAIKWSLKGKHSRRMPAIGASDLNRDEKVSHNNYTETMYPYHQMLVSVASMLQLFAFAITTAPDIASAVPGAAPKLEYFKRENDSPIGSAVYDESEKSLIEAKKASVLKRWQSMIDKVDTALDKGNKPVVQSTIANQMNALKSDMRLISKAFSGGDILIRSSKEDAAKFDYNSGQFALKPIATQAESIFSEINDIYFYSIKNDPEVTRQSVQILKRMFNDWYNLVN